MENRKIIYGSTSDFLKYVSNRAKEKERMNANRSYPKSNYKKRDEIIEPDENLG